ncbi:MAG: hypothetical protein ACR2PL_26700 [Dehalococcoidia bacterium]
MGASLSAGCLPSVGAQPLHTLNPGLARADPPVDLDGGIKLRLDPNRPPFGPYRRTTDFRVSTTDPRCGTDA